jgi:hypothetical protein
MGIRHYRVSLGDPGGRDFISIAPFEERSARLHKEFVERLRLEQAAARLISSKKSLG